MKTETKSKVTQSNRVTLRCKYMGNGARIKVSRYESNTYGLDPQRITVAWDYSLNPTENYEQAVAEYLNRAGWAGHWVVSTITDGAVAVYVGSLS